MARFDIHPYLWANQGWDYLILQLMDGTARASRLVYDSLAHNRKGYRTKEEAHEAGILIADRLAMVTLPTSAAAADAPDMIIPASIPFS